jgi:hypothetical protein
MLLGGPDVVWELAFGSWVLLQLSSEPRFRGSIGAMNRVGAKVGQASLLPDY